MQRQQQIMNKYLNNIDDHLVRLHVERYGETGFTVIDANCGSDIVTVSGEGIRLNVSAKNLIKKLKTAKTKKDFIEAINNA